MPTMIPDLPPLPLFPHTSPISLTNFYLCLNIRESINSPRKTSFVPQTQKHPFHISVIKLLHFIIMYLGVFHSTKTLHFLWRNKS